MTPNETLTERFRQLRNQLNDGDWRDVVARAEAVPPSKAALTSRDRRRFRFASGRVVVAAVAALMLVAVAVTPPVSVAKRIRNLFVGTPVSETQLSQSDWRVLTAANKGAPVSSQVQTLQGVGVAGIERIATRASLNFYIIDRTDGTRCFALGLTGSSNLFGQVSCPGPTFPSRQRPILDLSTWQTEPASGQRIGRFVGFAADGVAAVALRATDGTVHDRTPIDNNVYLRSTPSAEETATIVAFDRDSNRVYTCPFCVPPVPPFSGIPQDANIAAKQLVARFTTSGGVKVSTWQAPAKKGGTTCYWVEAGKNVIASGCPNLPPQQEMTAALSTTSTATLLIAETAADVAAVRVAFADGTEQIIEPVQGLAVAEIPARQLEMGHQATHVVAESASGERRAVIALRTSG